MVCGIFELFVGLEVVGLELPLRQLYLLPRLEGGHAQVGAAGATERVSQVALREINSKFNLNLNQTFIWETRNSNSLAWFGLFRGSCQASWQFFFSQTAGSKKGLCSILVS